MDFEIGVSAEALGDTAVRGAAEPAAATEDVQVSHRGKRVRHVVGVSVCDDLLIPLTAV